MFHFCKLFFLSSCSHSLCIINKKTDKDIILCSLSNDSENGFIEGSLVDFVPNHHVTIQVSMKTQRMKQEKSISSSLTQFITLVDGAVPRIQTKHSQIDWRYSFFTLSSHFYAPPKFPLMMIRSHTQSSLSADIEQHSRGNPQISI